MDREKQIEEMAKVINKSHWKLEQDFTGCHINSSEIAEYLYNAGYRKADDVAKEIFEEIDELLRKHFNECSKETEFKLLDPLQQAERFIINEVWKDVSELKKKYTEE